MIRYLLFPLSIVLVMVTSGFAQKNETKTFTVGAKTYNCIWHVPKDCNNPPVVFFIHGAKGSGKNFQNETKGDSVANREKFIAVYPTASSSDGVWDDMSGTTNFPFFKAVIDTLKRRYSIDTSRVYMTGFSQGGFISFVAACSFSKIFAAVAPVSGHAGSSCNLDRPVSVYLTYGGQEDVRSFAKDRDTRVKLNGCPTKPTRIFPYPASKPQSKISRLIYGPGTQGTYVIVDSIGGQGHQWPTAQKQAEEVWAFFKQFSLTGPITNVSASKSISSEKPAVISYSSGMIHIQGVEKNCNVKVTNTRGQVVLNRMNSGSQLSFTNKPSGVYLVVAGEKKNIAVSRIVVP